MIKNIVRNTIWLVNETINNISKEITSKIVLTNKIVRNLHYSTKCETQFF